MSEPAPKTLLAPLAVVTEWFASELTWDSFQTMSDEEMAKSVLAALAGAGYRFFRQMTEADEHYDIGGTCDHDGQEWPCAFMQAAASSDE